MPARPLPVLAVSLIFGTLTGAASMYLPLCSLGIAVVLLSVLFIGTAVGRSKPSFACLVYAFFLCGLASAALSQTRTTMFSLPDSPGSGKLDFVGEISEPVRYGPSRSAATVALRRILTADQAKAVEGRIRLTVRGAVPPLLIGDVIRFQARLRAPHTQLNPGGFDYTTYLLHHRIQAVGSINLRGDGAGPQVLTHVTYLIRDRADEWRHRIRDAALRTLDARASSVYLSLITGESGYLSQDTRDMFMSSGTTHILSISGSHLGLIGVVVFWIVRRGILALPAAWLLRLTLRVTATKVAAALTMPIVSFYAILGGAEVATVRSLLMLGLFLGAVLLGRTHHLGTGLAFAAVLIVLWDPLAPLDLSFQLSFLSVLVIVMLACRAGEPPPVIPVRVQPQADTELSEGGLLSRVTGKLKPLGKSVRELVFVGAAVTLITAPLVAMQFHQIAWVGLIANLIVVPFVGFLVVPLGLLGGVATLVSGSQNLQCATILQNALDVLLWMVHSFAAVPGARWMVRSPAGWQVVLFYACVAGIILIPGRWPRRVGVAVAAALLLLWVWSPRDLPEKGSVRLTFLDVGQGDAAVVETSEGPVMLIDGGGASDFTDQGRAVIAPFLWERGIRRLDLIIATHPQLDHMGGLASVVREFNVGEIWTNGIERDVPFARRLKEIANARHLAVRAVSSADGPSSLGGCTVHILNPAPGLSLSSTNGDRGENMKARGASFEGKHLNNQSIVIRLGCGRAAALYTGDIEEQAEERLVEVGTLASEILKVPHHGSRGSLSERFLEAVHPTFAVVSVGRANSYGHPAPSMLDLYRRLNIAVLRTDLHGAVTIVQSASETRIACEDARRFKVVAPHRAGGWRRELGNLRRLWSVDMPCVNA
jgi:competence protein ComEC